MYTITVSQVDDDGEVITTAGTDPDLLAVSVGTTGEILDVHIAAGRDPALGADELAELFVTCAQAAFSQRYDPLLEDESTEGR